MLLSPLYAVVDVDVCARAGRAPLAVADAFLGAGVTLIQIRAKTMASSDLLELAARMVARAGDTAQIIVNDRADIAVLAGAAGVHVGQDDLAVADVRALLGHDAVVGLSTHGIAQAEQALTQPVSYLAIGPVFETGTKTTGYEAVGLELVRRVAAIARARGVPVVAIGGITLERAPEVIAAGASAVCVISDLLQGDPGTRAGQYLQVLSSRSPGR